MNRIYLTNEEFGGILLKVNRMVDGKIPDLKRTADYISNLSSYNAYNVYKAGHTISKRILGEDNVQTLEKVTVLLGSQSEEEEAEPDSFCFRLAS